MAGPHPMKDERSYLFLRGVRLVGSYIAHRLSTEEAAILVFDRGRIAERGTRADLVAMTASMLGCTRAGSATSGHEDEMNDLLREELLEMATADLAAFKDMESEVSASPELRKRVDARSQPDSSSPAWPVEWTDDPPPSIRRLQTTVDRSTWRMKEIIRDAGWPGRSIVGEEGAAAAWLLIHHTADLDFQRACIARVLTVIGSSG